MSQENRATQTQHLRIRTLTLDRAIIASATSSALMKGLIVAYCPL